jgi:hypothetical protein
MICKTDYITSFDYKTSHQNIIPAITDNSTPSTPSTLSSTTIILLFFLFIYCLLTYLLTHLLACLLAEHEVYEWR